MLILGIVIGIILGVGLCLASAIYYPKPWLKLLKETGEEVKKTP